MTCWPPVSSAGTSPRRIRFTNRWVSRASWAARPSFLRRGPSSSVLFAGPWVGEFGWELMNWQGLLRALRPRYEKIIVSSRESSRALYDGVCDEFIAHDLQGDANSHVLFDIRNPAELERVLAMAPKGADLLHPLRYIPAAAQEFVPLGTRDVEAYPFDVLFHVRGRSSNAGRNWAVEKWNQLRDALQGEGYRLACIGLTSSTLDLPGPADLRDRSLRETCAAMASARLIVGPSSGPMHLASLCGLPQLIWTDQRTYGMGKSSREKYESWWNPLGTKVRVLDEHNFDPPVAEVLAAATAVLAQSPSL